ncbi:hypothetical protein MICCA_2170028 [Microcystis aeruginosa PCC 9432]|jgi:hypothetical protein|uniref:Uncharacterized protein n=1 Tax=Microcystis aeruginosa PCC 9432 TaxID=1160280 RepID=A0A822L723_MICAE|nr:MULTISPECIES: hypothetical protein [Microcystis]NCR39369.1 hypothetical protein [Microcystis aeruginosa W13-11]TRT94907.1 MAG: hypothetical protein EWV62_16225 [Microcystis aeruginosa Ma_OC_LR_19540900_S633]MCA2708054.1 hypothetical protein [Microcystis sp. M025S2]MCA2741022.1 hypothetical protein [Microcystis sp. M015S2]MCA2941221.1 hypothetical protein [Microcystis sp. M113S1]
MTNSLYHLILIREAGFMSGSSKDAIGHSLKEVLKEAAKGAASEAGKVATQKIVSGKSSKSSDSGNNKD